MRFERFFTQGHSDAYGLIHFRQPERQGDGLDVPLEHPDNWSLESVELLADESATSALPHDLKPIEENTVPSWLWRQSRARQVGAKETSVRDIFDRIAGAAAYRGWKLKLFFNEAQARIFFDEARYALAQRFIAIEPKLMAVLGLNWVYGIDIKMPSESRPASHPVAVSNAMIDTVVSGKRDRILLGKWHKIIGARAKAGMLDLHYADTEAQWESPMGDSFRFRLDLMAFRHNDGSVNIEALRHAVRLAVLLSDLQDEAAGPLAIGYANLAPLLLALALPYDSEAARATAAAISAIIMAEAYAVSAELAGLRGAAPDFIANRESALRALRNHRRAAYGECNDYEKIAVTPMPLALASCPDLALNAAARAAWDRALDLAQAHGLRHTQTTSLFDSPQLTLFMESETDGIAPLRSLLMEGSEGGSRTLHSSAMEALTRLGYNQAQAQSIARHATGNLTLEKAPAINHAALRAKGFTIDALERLEAFLPQARRLRHAFTPWVLGIEFCRKRLKIPATKIEDMRFNLLVHLGFKESDIAAAESYCYGHGTLDKAPNLNPRHRAVFATAATLSPEAQVRMAAAVQGFMSGATNLKLDLPVGIEAEALDKLLLDAWRRGVKSLTVTFDPALRKPALKQVQPARRKVLRRSVTTAFLHTKTPSLPKRASKLAALRLGGMSHSRSKSRLVSKGH